MRCYQTWVDMGQHGEAADWRKAIGVIVMQRQCTLGRTTWMNYHNKVIILFILWKRHALFPYTVISIRQWWPSSAEGTWRSFRGCDDHSCNKFPSNDNWSDVQRWSSYINQDNYKHLQIIQWNYLLAIDADTMLLPVDTFLVHSPINFKFHPVSLGSSLSLNQEPIARQSRKLLLEILPHVLFVSWFSHAIRWHWSSCR